MSFFIIIILSYIILAVLKVLFLEKCSNQLSKILILIIDIILSPLSILANFIEFFRIINCLCLFSFMYILPIIILNAINQKNSLPNFLFWLYIINLISVIIFCYFGSTIIMKFIIFIFNMKNKETEKKLEDMIKEEHMRLVTYVLMTIIYIVYNILIYNNINYILLDTIKEVFVSFIAIDSIVNQIKSNKTISK